MKTFFLALLLASSLFAQTAGPVQFNLPEGWKCDREVKDPKGATFFYTSGKESEFFSVNVNTLPFASPDQEALKGTMQQLFPELEITLTILEQSNSNLLYEWTAKGQETKIFSLSRAFVLQNGTAVLVYLTQDETDIDSKRSMWLSVLKEAHF